MSSSTTLLQFLFISTLIPFSLTHSVKSSTFQYPQFNATPSCSSTQAVGSDACSLLPLTIPALLATGSHPTKEEYVLIEPFSRFYKAGENPKTGQLVKDIPTGSLSPGDDLSAAVKSVGDFQTQHVMAENGYGEWKQGAEDGGLPSFCRFGATILTSDTSKTYFEVWLPLPDEDTVDEPDEELVEVSVGSSSSSTSRKRSTSIPSDQSHLTFQEQETRYQCEECEEGEEDCEVQDSSSNRFFTSNSTSSSSDERYCPGNFIPASRRGWIGRMVSIGTGGQRGIPEYDSMKQALIRMKVAVTGQNGGHFGSGGASTWAISNPEGQVDFGVRGVRVSGIAAQLTTSVFYGTIKGQEVAGDEESVAEASATSRSTSSTNTQSSPAEAGSSASTSSSSKSSKSLQKRTDNGSYFPLGFPSYFAGCSTGGRQAFSLVQNSPDLFNGVIAGSPVWDYNNLNAFQIHVNSLLVNKTEPTFISQDVYPLIHKAVLQACDELDGVVDQVVQKAFECKVDFRKRLLCGGGDDPSNQNGSLTSYFSCLTEPQVGNLETAFKPYTIGDKLIFPPFLPGTEDAWSVTDGWVGKPFPPAIGWYKWQVLNHTDANESFDPYTQVTPSVIQQGQDSNPGQTIQSKKDISEFLKAGGKLMHYHGLEDQLNPAGISRIYYDGVKDEVEGHLIDNGYRLYFVPGMGHCRGGAGPINFGATAQTDDLGAIPLDYDPKHDVFLATFKWTEGGDGPTDIVGVGYNSEDTSELPAITANRGLAEGIRITRKLCPHPQQAVYDGKRDPSKESSFECSDDSS